MNTKNNTIILNAHDHKISPYQPPLEKIAKSEIPQADIIEKSNKEISTNTENLNNTDSFKKSEESQIASQISLAELNAFWTDDKKNNAINKAKKMLPMIIKTREACQKMFSSANVLEKGMNWIRNHGTEEEHWYSPNYQKGSQAFLKQLDVLKVECESLINNGKSMDNKTLNNKILSIQNKIIGIKKEAEINLREGGDDMRNTIIAIAVIATSIATAGGSMAIAGPVLVGAGGTAVLDIGAKKLAGQKINYKKILYDSLKQGAIAAVPVGGAQALGQIMIKKIGGAGIGVTAGIIEKGIVGTVEGLTGGLETAFVSCFSKMVKQASKNIGTAITKAGEKYSPAELGRSKLGKLISNLEEPHYLQNLIDHSFRKIFKGKFPSIGSTMEATMEGSLKKYEKGLGEVLAEVQQTLIDKFPRCKALIEQTFNLEYLKPEKLMEYTTKVYIGLIESSLNDITQSNKEKITGEVMEVKEWSMDNYPLGI